VICGRWFLLCCGLDEIDWQRPITCRDLSIERRTSRILDAFGAGRMSYASDRPERARTGFVGDKRMLYDRECSIFMIKQ
jgi:hypothetical protein